MGLHSPFGYVGYEVPFTGLIISILEEVCGGCHTNNDYSRGCRGCPAGRFLYTLRAYVLEAHESDKQFELYASDEWAEKASRKPTEEERASWRRMTNYYRPEGDTLRALKAELKKTHPHPFFHGGFISDTRRQPDPLLKARELLKDLQFQQESRDADWRFQGAYQRLVKVRMRKEMAKVMAKLLKKQEERKEATDAQNQED